jgi:uncharacterized protein
MPVLKHRTELDHPVDEVFAWHTRPGAFERLAPPWEDIRVRRREGGMEVGSSVVLGLRKGPAELRWEVEHTAFEANRLFVDEQRKGPFARWRHEHRFEALSADRSMVEDVVEWEPPMGSLGRTFTDGWIERTLRRMFAFRSRRLENDLGLHARYGREPRLEVAITGSTGLVGETLVHFLRSGGHRVVRVRRGSAKGPDEVSWDPAKGTVDREGLEGMDAVVHLAGEPIAGVRWTSAKKEAIRSSRVDGTALLARTLAELRNPPPTLVSASGVDYYGRRGDEVITEDGEPGDSFLAQVCRDWEKATHAARAVGIRTVLLRTGMVLSPAGGALPVMLPAFQMGLGGRIGSGRQYLSWIDLDDHVALILHALRTPSLRGPVNATSPNPVPNASFADVLGRVLGRPTVIPLPSLAVRALLGQMGDELLLGGARVVPQRARETGFTFLFPDLEDSLRHQLGRTE